MSTLFGDDPLCGETFVRPAQGDVPAVTLYCTKPLGHAPPHGNWTSNRPYKLPEMDAAQAIAKSINQQHHPPLSIQASFEAFHAAHPEVYRQLCRLARALVRRGYTHLGIGMLWETLRYQTMLGSTPEEDSFRLNNNYRSRYARLIMTDEPDLKGIFETRTLTEAEG